MNHGRRQALAWIGGAVAAAGLGARAFAAPLDTVIKTGVMSFAVYQDFEPWAWRDKDGRLVGIDVDLADLLAQAIAVKADVQELMPGDDVAADLRNAVWRGSVLGRPPADVLMHVPVDRQLGLDNDRAVICAPYCRESFNMACNRDRVDDCEIAPDQFKGRPLAAEIDTVPDFYLSSTGGGVLRANVKHYPSAVKAVAAAAGGDADLVVATRAQIEHGMVAAPDKLIQRKAALPGMFSPGWNVGLAVKDNSRDLGDRLESVMAQLIANGKVAAIFERYGVVYRPPVDV
jgi:ABC-type amino acid transport substrate-binding protein